MNGAHDMGGMEGFGPVRAEPESEEPVFHASWERRVFGLNMAIGTLRQWNLDMFRFARERQHPAAYLSQSYYEGWLVGLETLLVEKGLLTDEELQSQQASSPSPDAITERVMRPEQLERVLNRKTAYTGQLDAPPRFSAGDRVRAINRHPSGHTREPRYVRGHVGTVNRAYGPDLFPDLCAEGTMEARQLYSVRFEARELWGADAHARSPVYVDLWEDYLEPPE